MQWLIDLIAEKVLQDLQGTILLWSGAVVDIPSGWLLCDGTSGTPDLRDRFVIGAGSTYNPDDSGGGVNHTHTFTGDGHSHSLLSGKRIAAGTGFDENTFDEPAGGTTNNGGILPPYYSLAYIMKS